MFDRRDRRLEAGVVLAALLVQLLVDAGFPAG
jgi:hypothetical protein